MTTDEAVLYGQSKGFFVRRLFGGIQFMAEQSVLEGITSYGKVADVQFHEEKWHLRSVGAMLTSFESLEEAIFAAEKCLIDEEYLNALWEQAKARMLKEQHDTSP